jgi:Fe-S-cluster containining protein
MALDRRLVQVRPLLVRDGARFTCSGDGLCCTDVHLLGPVSKRERAPIEAIATHAVVRGKQLTVLTPQANGHCVFLSAESGCAIYDTGAKPKSCHRFPFTLAATPEGGRVGTDHRCPCRTMGERAEIRPETTAELLTDSAGRLWADRRIEPRIALSHQRVVSFARYRQLEESLLASLARGELLAVVGDGVLPPRADGLWESVANELDQPDEYPTRWSLMQQAFARGLRAVLRGGPVEPFERPWAESFERAEKRSREVRDPAVMLADWIADVIWSLEWSASFTLSQTRVELGARARIARLLAAHLEARAGARRDTAMAEAIAIVEVSGLADAWMSAVARLRA